MPPRRRFADLQHRERTLTKIPDNVESTVELLSKGSYIADRSLGTAVHLALQLHRPLFLEGEAGVGKTEIA
ncbi:MAG: hypothetical protein HKN28_06240, partial [Alphaproteobacteria bacterium]|nr:hypothetical protein [Alphaproteobacteria bacterium]